MITSNIAPALIQTKQHFKILDGLRGVAAIAVVIFHFMEISVPDYNDSFIAHAYLAVDFFFCLSGFVVAYAYDGKFAEIGMLSFLKLRFIRLHPLVIIGSVIGLLAFIFDPFSNLYLKYSDKLVSMFLASCFMIPYPLVHERYFNLFHLNAPAWSLFWEYIANIAYALVLVKMRNKILWLLTAVAAVALIYEARLSGNLGVGWGGDNISGGGIRVFFSFLAGILVYRSSWIISSRLNFLAIAVLLLGVFMIPFSKDYNPYMEPLIVIFFFPFLVALGAGAGTGKATGFNTQNAFLSAQFWTGICNFSGDISYPLYMVHYPFIRIFMSYVELKKPSMDQKITITIIAVILLIAFAYLILKYLDLPIRRWLRSRMLTQF